MRGLSCATTALLVLAMTFAAFAESDIPDLKGKWMLRTHAVLHSKKKEAQPQRHTDTRNGFVEIDMVLTIDKQEGARFSGTKSSDKRTEKISGVIGFDNKTVYMVDDDGIMFCKLVGPDRMEQIYLQAGEHRSVVYRAILTRKR